MEDAALNAHAHDVGCSDGTIRNFHVEAAPGEGRFGGFAIEHDGGDLFDCGIKVDLSSPAFDHRKGVSDRSFNALVDFVDVVFRRGADEVIGSIWRVLELSIGLRRHRRIAALAIRHGAKERGKQQGGLHSPEITMRLIISGL